MKTEIPNDVPRYRKKSKKKGEPKADHKHLYAACVFAYYGIHLERNKGFVQDDYLSYSIGTCCSVCHRVGTKFNREWMRKINYWPTKENWHEQWTDAALREINPDTRTLPIYFLEGEWPKYAKEME